MFHLSFPDLSFFLWICFSFPASDPKVMLTLGIFICASSSINIFFPLLVFLGNGTLNKLAGIDYKQLSLIEKRNENHSGEVFYLIPVFYSAFLTSVSTDDCIKPCVVYLGFSVFVSHL